jgi:hypothetical protein
MGGDSPRPDPHYPVECVKIMGRSPLQEHPKKIQLTEDKPKITAFILKAVLRNFTPPPPTHTLGSSSGVSLKDGLKHGGRESTGEVVSPAPHRVGGGGGGVCEGLLPSYQISVISCMSSLWI